MSISQDYKRYDFTIKIEELHERVKEVIKLGYGETIQLKFNGVLIHTYDLLRFLLPTKDTLIKLNKYPLELKINGYYYEVLK